MRSRLLNRRWRYEIINAEKPRKKVVNSHHKLKKFLRSPLSLHRIHRTFLMRIGTSNGEFVESFEKQTDTVNEEQEKKNLWKVTPLHLHTQFGRRTRNMCEVVRVCSFSGSFGNSERVAGKPLVVQANVSIFD